MPQQLFGVRRLGSLCSAVGLALAYTACGWQGHPEPSEAAATADLPRTGGRLVVAMGSAPRTFNPVLAADLPSVEIIKRTTADLIWINRLTQSTEPRLAESFTVSEDGLRHTVSIRPDVKFSDGHAFDADDVVFTFEVFQDEEIGSPTRDLLVVNDQPIALKKLDAHTVAFTFPKPRAVGDRVFDGIPILPSHLLEEHYRDGTLNEAWGLGTPPEEMAGLGPFRLKSHTPAQQVVLERNPHFWRTDERGIRLPYLDEIVFVFVPNKEAQLFRFRNGDINVIDDLSAENFSILEREQDQSKYRVTDLGAGLRFNFLFFNLNDLPNDRSELRAKQDWFRIKEFRQAISAAIDREAVAELVYRGRATPIWSPVSPADKLFFHAGLPQPARSLDRARKLLRQSGFEWQNDRLVDPKGRPVAFTIVTNSSNSERVQIMAVVQQDLRKLGIKVQAVPIEFRSLLSRILETLDYELCILGLTIGDADPNPLMNVLISSGASHLWSPGRREPETPWQAEIDRLMTQQATVLDHASRKAMYDRVQELIAENLPMIPLVSPHVLVGRSSELGNFKPALLQHHTLWNAEELFWMSPPGSRAAGGH